MKLVFKLPLSVAVAGATFSGISLAQDWYVSGSVSWNQQNSSETTIQIDDGLGGVISSEMEANYDDGIGVAAELGRTFDNVLPGLRGSLEVTYTKAEVDNFEMPSVLGTGTDTITGGGDIENIGVFLNAYYDFDLNLPVPIKPYIGAGAGFTMSEVAFNQSGGGVTATFFDDDDMRFAYQGKVGATYDLEGNSELFAEYTYRASEDLTFGNTATGEYSIENSSHLVGARACAFDFSATCNAKQKDRELAVLSSGPPLFFVRICVILAGFPLRRTRRGSLAC